MSSCFGNHLHVSLFGESHGPAVGCVFDAPPPGHTIDLDAVARHMARRAPGQSGAWSTPRKEADAVEILSGLYRGKTTGTPLAVLIRNTNTRSGDYDDLAQLPRPGHADLTGRLRYRGANDPNGGGHFSARVTAGLTFAGAVALQILAARGICVRARILEIAGISDLSEISDREMFEDLSGRPLAVLSVGTAAQMTQAIEKIREEQNSVGGIIEVRASGFPAGIGSPFFDRIESRLGSMFFSLNAVRAVEFGDGMNACRATGKTNNDIPTPAPDGNALHAGRASNHAGGAEGGISTGLPIIARIGFKPTPSIAAEQQSLNLSSNTPAPLRIHGRHDPCVVPRAVPLVESAAAFALLDLLSEARPES